MQINCVLRTGCVNSASPQDLCIGLRTALSSALPQTNSRRKLSYLPYFQVPELQLLHLFTFVPKVGINLDAEFEVAGSI